jgi:hypothetical protein
MIDATIEGSARRLLEAAAEQLAQDPVGVQEASALGIEDGKALTEIALGVDECERQVVAPTLDALEERFAVGPVRTDGFGLTLPHAPASSGPTA